MASFTDYSDADQASSLSSSVASVCHSYSSASFRNESAERDQDEESDDIYANETFEDEHVDEDISDDDDISVDDDGHSSIHSLSSLYENDTFEKESPVSKPHHASHDKHILHSGRTPKTTSPLSSIHNLEQNDAGNRENMAQAILRAIRFAKEEKPIHARACDTILAADDLSVQGLSTTGSIVLQQLQKQVQPGIQRSSASPFCSHTSVLKHQSKSLSTVEIPTVRIPSALVDQLKIQTLLCRTSRDDGLLSEACELPPPLSLSTFLSIKTSALRQRRLADQFHQPSPEYLCHTSPGLVLAETLKLMNAHQEGYEDLQGNSRPLNIGKKDQYPYQWIETIAAQMSDSKNLYQRAQDVLQLASPTLSATAMQQVKIQTEHQKMTKLLNSSQELQDQFYQLFGEHHE